MEVASDVKLARKSLRLRLPLALAAAIATACVLLTAGALSPLRAATSQVVFAQHPCTPIYASPSAQAAMLTQLIGGSDVTVLGSSDVAGTTWDRVHMWSGVEGYVPADLLDAKPPASAEEGTCLFPGVPDAEEGLLQTDHGPWPFREQGVTVAAATILAQPDNAAVPLGALAVGSPVSILTWASDAVGKPWYQVEAGETSGWIWSGVVRLAMPNPASRIVEGKPIWSPVAGKGMWFTNYLPRHSDMSAMINAARLAGITHLYAEVAITQYGFYGRNTLDRLLPAAHAAGIAVIAWVYPDLSDISADVRLTTAVAAYKTPSGDHADGIATDVEETDDGASVYTYGQVIRGLLGPDVPLVAAVFHPFAQTYYPYAAIAASWNVIAPMDYWHSRAHHDYTTSDVRRFVSESLMTIRAAMSALGPDSMLPIEELGQTYDMYSDDGTGAHDAPTGAELTSDMQTARDFGCIGASFFEWQTTTQDEWAAIKSFSW